MVYNIRHRKFSYPFNDSWFVFHYSNWSFHESYLAEKTHFMNLIEWTEHNKMVLLNLQTRTKLLNNVVILTFLLTILTIIHFFIEQKFCKYILRRRKNKQQQNIRELTVQTFIYYLIYSGAREAFRKIIQPCSITRLFNYCPVV